MSQKLLSLIFVTATATALVLSSQLAYGRVLFAAARPNSAAALHRDFIIAQPNSMGAAGDSVTTAFDVNSAGLLKANPAYSWSTGSNPAVYSQYARILAKNKLIKNHAYNVAKFGATMSALPAQMKVLASDHVAYATVLMGDNDVCTTTVANMTSVSTFRTEFQTALKYFFAHDSKAHVFVSSLNNVYRLWQLFNANSSAQYAWQTLAPILLGHGACPSMLNPKNTAAQRQAVLQREVADNAALAAVCKTFAGCRWDNDAAFKTKFTTADISTADYISPSVQGQKDLAATSWSESYWAGR